MRFVPEIQCAMGSKEESGFEITAYGEVRGLEH